LWKASRICVVLGDNLIGTTSSGEQAFEASQGCAYSSQGRFRTGALWLPGDFKRRILSIEEKPKIPNRGTQSPVSTSMMASFFEKLAGAQPSWRNELEITDVKQHVPAGNTCLTVSWTDGRPMPAHLNPWFGHKSRGQKLELTKFRVRAPPRHVRAAK